MSTPYRPARTWPTLPAAQNLVLAEPPVGAGSGLSWGSALLPALGVLPMIGFLVRSPSRGGPLLLVLLLVPTLGGGLALAVGQRRRHRRATTRARERWCRHREELLGRCADAALAQRLALDRRHPDSSALLALLADGSAFERRPGDSDALHVCVGIGPVPALVRMTRNAPPGAELTPDLDALATDAVRRTATVPSAPVTVALAEVGLLAVLGTPPQTAPVAAALLAQLAALHAPGELDLAVTSPAPESWTWAAALPHARASPTDLRDLEALAAWLTEPYEVPHRVAFIDGYVPGGSQTLDRALVRTDAVVLVAGAALPARAGARLDCVRAELTVGTDSPVRTRLDVLETLPADSAHALGNLARGLAPHRPYQPPDLAALLAARRDTDEGAALRVPLGVDATGAAVLLDLREAAAGGDGPHALLVGATGSGKSVALQTVVGGLAASYPPERLALLLVDFKGGAAFDCFDALPHVAGVVTNLETDPAALRRIRLSLDAEIERRQRSCRVDPAHLPVPLVIVVDEAGELLAAAPDMADLFARVGRVGRSLGIHLLLSTQRWDEGRLRALDTHLRIRICLRTFTAEDSRAVLGNDAAWRLPARPGTGWLAVDGHARRVEIARASTALPIRGGAPVRPVWLPPLPAQLAPSAVPDAPGRSSALHVAVGLVDLPGEQGQEGLEIDLGAGHLAVAGSSGSGVSTLLSSVVTALARRSGPGALEVHLLDLAGGLGGLAILPHVGTRVPPGENDWAGEVLSAVRQLIDDRLRAPPPEVRQGARGLAARAAVVLVVDGVDLLRRDRHDRGAPAAGLEREAVLADIARQGPAAGVHLVLGVRRWTELRSGLLELCPTRWELRLADPAESHAGRVAARALRRTPGRGLTADGHEFQAVVDDPRGLPVDGLAPVAPILPLPTEVPAPAADGNNRFALGVAGPRREPEHLDLLRPGTHLLITGPAGGGRTTLLRRITTHLSAVHPSARCVVVDPRRGRRPAAPDRDGLGLPDMLTALQERALAATGQEQRPPWVLLADDIDLALAATSFQAGPADVLDTRSGLSAVQPHGAASPAGCLAALVGLLPWSAQLGFHLCVVAPAPGAGVAADALAHRIRAAGVVELALGAAPTGPPGRYTAAAGPPGRGTLSRPGAAPVVVQCFNDGPG